MPRKNARPAARKYRQRAKDAMRKNKPRDHHDRLSTSPKINEGFSVSMALAAALFKDSGKGSQP